jgi:hypothetical protein
MLEKKLDSKYFDLDKKKCFPPANTMGGLIAPYSPNDFERNNCGYAPKGFDCKTKRTGPLGGQSHVIRCNECLYHPINKRF